MTPPPEVPKLWRASYYGPDGDVCDLLVQGYQYESGTYFLFQPDGIVTAISMEATGYVTFYPIRQEQR